MKIRIENKQIMSVDDYILSCITVSDEDRLREMSRGIDKLQEFIPRLINVLVDKKIVSLEQYYDVIEEEN